MKKIDFLVIAYFLMVSIWILLLPPTLKETRLPEKAAETPQPVVYVSPRQLTPGELLNAYRLQNGLPEWLRSDLLSQSAQDTAEKINSGEYGWSHRNFEGRIAKFYGKPYTVLEENLAADFNSFEEVFAAWKNSKTHNDNLLRPQTCEYGLGVSGSIWVLHTGCRK